MNSEIENTLDSIGNNPYQFDKSNGTAKIKPQFSNLNHKRKLVIECLDVPERQKIEKSENLEENINKPFEKLIKLKGRNVKRPRLEFQKKAEKLCPSIIRERICSYGDKCCFSHNVIEFLNKKPPDIGHECYVFKMFGKCPQGVACRFGKSHLNEDGKNIINEKLFVNKIMTKNNLSKEVQIKLRKKKYFKIDNTNQIKGNLLGIVTDEDIIRIRPEEKKKIDFTRKSYLAPLTTVGNLPFRRICKYFGADITCGEMALCPNILQGHQSEWALLKRHLSEDIFGIQICATSPDLMTRCAQLLNETIEVDFIDINLGCPIDIVYNKGNGCAMMRRTTKLEQAIKGMKSYLTVPLTIKMRTGISADKPLAHSLITNLKEWGVDMITLHGRSREQRYTKLSNWDYINECSKVAHPIPLFGNGDILSFEEFNSHMKNTAVSGAMIGRGALIKPWIFTELKEQRHWDISSTERLDILKNYVNYGLEHWGSDSQGVETTRRFLLEWLSFLHRYIPVGILESPPQCINERPPYYNGRNDLETLMASANCSDWIKISEMLLGRVPDNFSFLPKHKANSYQ